MRAGIKGLAARAVINYIMTELNEIESISKEEINNVLHNALNLIELEESDIRRVKEVIERLINS
mgnify:CR=1 FL=1